MRSIRFAVVLVATFLLFNSCSIRKCIYYCYEGSVNDSLTAAVHELKSMYENKPIKIYGLMSNSIEDGTSVVFNDYSNMPIEIKKLIKSSNRYIVISSKKIPLIFYLDDESNFIKDSRWAHLPYTGFIVRFYKTRVYYKGVLF